MSNPLPLADRIALITGVSRPRGIGAAIARRVLADGASVLATGWPKYDAELPWGADADEVTASLVRDLDPRDGRFQYEPADLEDPETPRHLVARAVHWFGGIDMVIANHARGSAQPLDRTTAAELDRCWAVNARGSVLLAQAFDAAHSGRRRGGRLVLFTSGQHLRPMSGEIAYMVSKGAIHQMTASLSNHLADKGITVNCVNPGPVDTGYAEGEDHRRIAAAFPAKRWGQPDDVARLVAWLVSDEAEWITGQVLNSEGGWRVPSFD